MRSAVLVVPVRGTGQDRAAVVATTGGLVAVLADGAGGTGGGDRAAQAVVDTVVGQGSALDWTALLEELDADPARLGMGQTTAVVVEITGVGIRGASVGDSIASANGDELTRFQRRKPLLGSGEATVIALGAGPLVGRLVIGSDGLWKYAAARDIEQVVRDTVDLAEVPARLVDLVRRRTGTPPDDLSIIVVESP